MAVLSLPVVLLNERSISGGRVFGAGGVAKERFITVGRVLRAAGGVLRSACEPLAVL